MAQNSFTETTTRSYGSRLGNSLFGILIGLGMLVGSIVLIWWNEGRTVAQADMLSAGLKATTVLPQPQYNPANDNKLVYVNGVLKGGTLTDKLFGVQAEGLSLMRHVEMYQWKESVSEKKVTELGGSEKIEKTYNYSKNWQDKPILSSKFKHPEGHENPRFTYNDQRFNAKAAIGDFKVNNSLLNLADGSQPFAPQGIETTTGGTLQGSNIYIGSDSSDPQVGDMRISYSLIPDGTYSIVAEQTPSQRLEIHAMPENGSLAFITSGTQSAQELFDSAQRENTLIAWGLRMLGLLLMFIGFLLIMGPITTLASIIPFLGNIVGAGAGIIAALLTLILGGSIIVIAWFIYHPWLTAILVLSIAGLVYMAKKRLKAQKENQPQWKRKTPQSAETAPEVSGN